MEARAAASTDVKEALEEYNSSSKLGKGGNKEGARCEHGGLVSRSCVCVHVNAFSRCRARGYRSKPTPSQAQSPGRRNRGLRGAGSETGQGGCFIGQLRMRMMGCARVGLRRRHCSWSTQGISWRCRCSGMRVLLSDHTRNCKVTTVSLTTSTTTATTRTLCAQCKDSRPTPAPRSFQASRATMRQ